jgi:transposase-like protein
METQTTEPWLLELQGPRPWTEAEGRRVVTAWEASGVSVASFARLSGLVADKVYRWRARLGPSDKAATSVAHGVAEMSVPAFLPVTVRAAPSSRTSAAVTVCIREELRVEVVELDATSAAWVAALVRSLAEVSS